MHTTHTSHTLLNKYQLKMYTWTQTLEYIKEKPKFRGSGTMVIVFVHCTQEALSIQGVPLKKLCLKNYLKY